MADVIILFEPYIDDGLGLFDVGKPFCFQNFIVQQFIECLWQSLKYEAADLHETGDGFIAKRIMGDWIDFYKTKRPHSSLDGNTPIMAYRGSQTRNLAA